MIIINGDGGCRHYQPIGNLIGQIGGVCESNVLSMNSSNKSDELWQWHHNIILYFTLLFIM